MKYALFTGCAAKGACPELYQSATKVAQLLGLELTELKSAACCGAGVVGEGDPDLALAINARTFAQAEATGLPVMTICGTCQGVLSGANKRLKEDPATRERINGMLAPDGIAYGGTTEVKHLLWVLIQDVGLERLRKAVTRSLAGLRIAPFYGCYILRPSTNLGFDDPNNPTSLEMLITALGGERIDYSGRIKCCGFPLVLEQESMALAMSGDNTAEAKREGADCMVTPCPLCHMSLDIYQQRAERLRGERLDMPIFHLPQLVGLALGLSEEDLGLSRHMVSVAGAVTKLGGDSAP
ncbi:MAG: CoB--CoM heterodisulfide reductase iron-sulfur subunit B family protein [Nitrospiria bacterium]